MEDNQEYQSKVKEINDLLSMKLQEVTALKKKFIAEQTYSKAANFRNLELDLIAIKKEFEEKHLDY